MQTEPLYMSDCYMKEFDAKIMVKGPDYVVLDKTAFYPLGGGQESDLGTLNNVMVTGVRKADGEVRHYVKDVSAFTEGKEVHGVIDWGLRYPRMRMHTAQHLLSAIFLDKWEAETVGNQIHETRSRMDFNLDDITPEMLTYASQKFDEYVDASLPVTFATMPREEMMKKVDEKRRRLFERLPAVITSVRVVTIQGIDDCPCAGTHIKNTKEIGHIKIIGTVSKGAGKRRIEFELMNQ